MRYGSEHKAQTRARVLSSAVQAIREGGPDSVGVADVMKRSGLTHGGFYAHFASREDLLLAAVGTMFDATQNVFDRRTEGLEPRERLRAFIEFYLSVEHRDSREVGCPLATLVGDLPRMTVAVKECFSEGLDRLTKAMTEKVRAIGHAEPAAAAGDALSAMIGALALARAVGAGSQSDAILANTRSAVIARLGFADTI